VQRVIQGGLRRNHRYAHPVVHVLSHMTCAGSSLAVWKRFQELSSKNFARLRRWWRAAERRHPSGRERMGSPTLQTLQYPILLLPCLCFRVAAFQTLARGPLHAPLLGLLHDVGFTAPTRCIMPRGTDCSA
jgi:hypothetical protein